MVATSGRTVLVLCVYSSLIIASGGYSIPAPTFTVTFPKGLRVTIPDVPDLQSFGFFGRVNNSTATANADDWPLAGDVTQPTNGLWIFESTAVALAPGDIIHYNIFVQHGRLGYYLDNQQYHVVASPVRGQRLTTTRPPISTVTQRPPTSPPTTPTMPPTTPPTTPVTCNKSATVVNKMNPCKGELLFEETFDSFNPNIWRKEIRMPLDTNDANFVSFQHYNEECYVRNGTLFITPHLLRDKPGFDDDSMDTGTLDLGSQCTEFDNAACYRSTASYRIILPPIVSAKINTRESFRFLYGKVEIRAKLPKGQWILPLLNLEPAQQVYGNNLYDSGLIRMGFARGNDDGWKDDDFRFIDGHTVYAGLILSPGPLLRSRWMKFYENDVHLGNDFHVYTANWTPDYISFELDGERYAIFSKNFVRDHVSLLPSKGASFKRGSAFAPFDQEFYLSLGVSAGGIADFPDYPNAANAKPWTNTDPNAQAQFWEARDQWYGTWTEQNTPLQVDYVRVYAL